MKVLADTNWLISAYFTERTDDRTGIVARFSIKWDVPWLLCPAVLLEARNAFAMTSGLTNSPQWKSLNSHLGTKLIAVELPWNGVLAKTEELVDRFGHKARVGTLDMMILASALKADATHFLSFDTNSSVRALAAVLKLKVFPALTSEDKRRMIAFR